MFMSGICLQSDISPLSFIGYCSCFLNDSDDTIELAAGLNFIYEVQLSKVLTIEKWNMPIKMKVEGNPSKEDINILNHIIKDFNKVNGFPDMGIVNEDENVLLIYVPKADLSKVQKEYNLGEIDKGICQSFSENGEIQRAIIVIESDVDQDYKNSVVLHEIFHMIGFYGHSYDNASVLNQIEKPVPKLSTIDTLAFRMLYNPEIMVGMNYHELNIYYQDKEITNFCA
ncbi:hypothetical protein MmiEs2_13870 [Methanimicrococcus stummii]|uniref:Uncharacterized protein n=1 Tax=Methanimicrococcus stummii TaxID=3028294 RepID=A0AA96ZXN1_9EURY|nr:DUF2927 domain-containing protein [Methanimicrococcus sp. Es2]WNY29164.1 hypothetical protein MmiEs2_13870 [Methanimicrococcus sp. Es2]